MTHPAWRIGGTFVLVLFFAWAGARLYWLAHPPSGLAVTAGRASTPSPADLSADSPLSAAVRIPERLPLFTLNDLAGKSTSSSAWQGQPLVINFWATWCAPCRREIPLLQALSLEWAADHVAVIGIAVDHPGKVRDFRDQLHIGYPLLVGEQDALDTAAKFGMASPVFPFTVFTDRHGEVVALYLGELHRPQASLIMAAVRDLDRGQVLLPEARRHIAAGLDALAAQAPQG